METECELLMDGVVGVDQHMAGIAVDTRETDELDGDPRLFGDLTDDSVHGGFADLDATSRQLPVAVVDATDQQELAYAIAYRRERGR